MNPRPHNVWHLLSRHRKPSIKVSKEFRALLTQRRHDKHSDEDAEMQAVLHYLEDKATELAQNFKKPQHHYLEQFSLGSKLQWKKREKTSMWSAWVLSYTIYPVTDLKIQISDPIQICWTHPSSGPQIRSNPHFISCSYNSNYRSSPFVHFKGIKCNSGKDRRSKMAEIINDRAEYSSLTEEEKEELVKEFDEVKKCATNHPPNITPRVKATKSAKSFLAVKDKLNALSQHVGIEAFIFMVRRSSDFQMAPKAYFTSTECEQFMRVYLRRNAARTATDFESAMLSKGFFNSAPSNHKDCVSRAKSSICTGLQTSLCEVTNDALATVEFTKYEALVVCCYHIKLMGWNHTQWANPSDLKGGIEALEKLADAIKAKTCCFVQISAEEVEERRRKITDLGALLTPETEPPIPPVSSSDALHSQVTRPSPSPLALPDLSSHPSSAPNNTLVDTSETAFNPFTDDLIDPALHKPSSVSSLVTPISHSDELIASPPAPFDNPNTVVESTLHATSNTRVPMTNITPPMMMLESPTEHLTSNIHQDKRQAEVNENEESQPHAKWVRKLTMKQAALEEEARARTAGCGKSKKRA
ncbi:hypothetical protein F4604DRAFT_1920174 [Suillus subluteus]|nr:hypothetical protein F4604DRAFT_1920174 [Suillus subluteus]